ncbi:phosphotransferase [Gordonia jinghuaiqii]|uniref:Phosphotransferase family protein n=1 Tax=Gordonia jinghuaiqii TaxID=2758710 RepID=A0A7D7QZQ2_9ACTN|nr:phosphotransferase family protein [Gordonia jinghuaiqii]MCR5978763.1 phosphotransferase [Gordonia jinghuaiqii]QMT03069.1 phosphotransferase family protein [Gordonia jinghuaiqii]
MARSTIPDRPAPAARLPVDPDALAGWMDDQGLPGGDTIDLEPLRGGTQNIMVTVSRGGRRYVLRRGPRHLRPQSNAVIAREMTLLAALRATDVAHPRFVAGTDDPAVLGATFYLMEPVDGFNAAEMLPAAYAATPEGRKAMGYALIDALAGLAAVDHTAVGLRDFGKPEGFLERQVPRWLAEHERFASTPGYPGGTFGDLERVAGWLEDNRPGDFRPGLLHGDYHVANVLFDHRRPEVAAIVDWEMATVGDPLLDLGVLLAIWPDSARRPDLYESALGLAGDLPTRSEIVARYAERSDRDLSALDWYTVLASFKLGIILEGTYARSCDGKAPRDVGERLHRYAEGLFGRARHVIDGS